jgi:hypothetical protein
MGQLRRVNLWRGRDEVCLLLNDAQMNTDSFGESERFNGSKGTVAEDGINVADHGLILTSTSNPCTDTARRDRATAGQSADELRR